MNDSVERPTAQQVRQRVREARALQSQANAELPPPLIDDSRIADKTDNTVSAEYLKDLDKELIIEIPKWELVLPGRDKDQLTVYRVDGEELFTGNYDQNDDVVDAFPLQVTIPKAVIRDWVDGAHAFAYKVKRYNGVTSESDTLTLMVDTRPPYLDRPPVIFPAVGEVREANKGTVSVELPSYADQQPKDHVWVFWLKEVPEDIWTTEPVAKVEVTVTPQVIPIPQAAIVTLKPEQLGKTIEASIPWEAIRDAGNGTIKVHYAISRDGVPNPAQSPLQDVAVDAVVLRPDAPEFDLPGGRWLNCDALWTPGGGDPLDPAFRVLVPDLSVYGLKSGDTVKLKWWATTYVSETPIPAVNLEESIELGEDTVKGFTWRVQPYATYILPIDTADPTDRDGYGYASYEFTSGDNTVRSKEAKAPISINTPGGTCDITSR